MPSPNNPNNPNKPNDPDDPDDPDDPNEPDDPDDPDDPNEPDDPDDPDGPAAEVVLGPRLREKARAHLLELAGEHDAKDLRRLGKRILDVIAPELGEAQEAKILAAEEARAAATASFTMTDDGTGRCHGRFILPSLTAAMLRQHLLALTNPQRHPQSNPSGDGGKTGDAINNGTAPTTDTNTGEGQWRPMPERLGAALVEYIERYPAEHTPDSGGVAATIVVTMTLETLTGDLTTAALNTGDPISAGEARRLACEAGIIPAVLDGTSHVLDLGRKNRFHTQAQRIALAHRDHGCTAQGCDLPPAACHAHHDHPWSHGGTTTTTTGRLLCPRHHRIAHQPHYDHHIHPDNSITFHRRT